jgi:acyl-CoA thioesterase-1
MVKRFILAIIVLIILLLILELISLIELKSKVKEYGRYWQKPHPNSGSFTYVALGDSAAQAVGASAPQLGYVGLLAKRIALKTGKRVRIVNLSASGAQIQDVLDTQLPRLVRLRKVDLITLEIGANNVVHWDPLTFTEQYNQLLSVIPAGTIVANIPYFGGRIRRDKQAAAANQIIGNAVKNKNLSMVDLFGHTHTHQSLLNYAADMFHPSNKGYQNWCDAFWYIVERDLNTIPGTNPPNISRL